MRQAVNAANEVVARAIHEEGIKGQIKGHLGSDILAFNEQLLQNCLQNRNIPQFLDIGEGALRGLLEELVSIHVMSDQIIHEGTL